VGKLWVFIKDKKIKMSRRLEVIPTGFIDYGKFGESFMAGIQQGRNIVLQEEERQRRIQDQENQRLSAANQIYRQNQSDLERFGTDLSTSEKLKFTSQFDGIMNMNREMQSWIAKGGKVGSPEYNALQDNIEKQKKNLQMNIGALKEVKGGLNELISLQKNKYIVDDSQVMRLQQSYNDIINGKYVPSTELPNKQTIVQSAYISPNAIYESVVPKIQSTEKQSSYKRGKEVITEKSRVPNYFEVESAGIDLVNRSPVESAGIVKDYNKFKSAADTDLGDFKNRYDLYSMYMKDVDKTPKQAKDMTPSDYAMMEIISRSYKPDPSIFSKYTEPKKVTGGKPTQAEQKAKITESIADDVFSTDASKSNDAISQIQGALELGGYSISKSGNTLNVFKGKDIYDPNGLDIKIPLDKNNKKSVSTLKTLIKKYITATGG
jgi:hypothetical protein